MGALLSLPLIPVQIAATSLASCAGAGISTALCSLCGSTFSSSIATRVVYAIMFVANSLLAWLSLNDWIVGKLGLIKYACDGDECTGFIAVNRITSSLGVLHMVLALTLAALPGATPPKTRATIQNGWWRFKFFGWATLLVSFFFIPADFWVFYGNYIAPIGSFVFIFIGLVLLVDCAHTWAETCVEKIEEAENPRMWQTILVGSTLGMYVAALVLTILMFVFFAGSGCSMNQAAITLNVIFALLASTLSVHPEVQERNPQAGLAQSAMVAMYCTYLTMSAVAAEPDDRSCNPLVRSRGTRTASIVMGAVFTFLAIAYTTTRAASRAVGASEPEDDHEARMAVRNQALRQAVAEGTLPASALDDAEWEDEEAVAGPGYNYILFHVVFMLATMYISTLLTMNVQKDPVDDFVPVGRTYFASWTKIISAWICYALYAWSLLAPVVMPDRFG